MPGKNIENFMKTFRVDEVRKFEWFSKQMAVEMGILYEDSNSGEDDKAPVIVQMDNMEMEAHVKAKTCIKILHTANVVILLYLLKKRLKT